MNDAISEIRMNPGKDSAMEPSQSVPASAPSRDADDSSEIDAVYRKIAWRIIPLLMIGGIAAYLDRANIGFARVQMLGDLGFSEVIYGLGAGLFYLGYSVFEVPSNLLLKKIGARLTFARIMILWGMISGCFALVQTATQFTVLRFLLGCAEAGFFPGALLYLTYWVPVQRRARFTAMFMSSMVLSGLISGPISGLIMASMEGLAGLRGWQWLFIIEAIPPVILGIVVLVAMSDGPARARWLSPREKAIVEADLARDRQQKTTASSGPASHTLLDAFKDYRIYVLGCVAIALVPGIAGLTLWIPTILKSAGVEGYAVLGLLSGLPYLVAIVVQQWVAHHSDRTGERRWHVAICLGVCGLGWVLLPSFADHPWISLGLLVIATGGAMGATGPFWTLPSTYLSGTAAAGGIALVSTFGGIFAFVSPILVGWANDFTGTLAAGQYYYGALFLLAATILPLCIPPVGRERTA